ncbi:MAG: hypothetical protein BGO98_18555 [Myxococcales bacterium 68-20]|nr:MAG: hypothetical protein BGO98_18555 [Myxococcales bacterium 68-20]
MIPRPLEATRQNAGVCIHPSRVFGRRDVERTCVSLRFGVDRPAIGRSIADPKSDRATTATRQDAKQHPEDRDPAPHKLLLLLPARDAPERQTACQHGDLGEATRLVLGHVIRVLASGRR